MKSINHIQKVENGFTVSVSIPKKVECSNPYHNNHNYAIGLNNEVWEQKQYVFKNIDELSQFIKEFYNE